MSCLGTISGWNSRWYTQLHFKRENSDQQDNFHISAYSFINVLNTKSMSNTTGKKYFCNKSHNTLWYIFFFVAAMLSTNHSGWMTYIWNILDRIESHNNLSDNQYRYCFYYKSTFTTSWCNSSKTNLPSLLFFLHTCPEHFLSGFFC